ncbi:MAG: transcriptional repressor [Firmicutes bacterium]|nr:transcriptional repressor [Bacillota bacterium]MCM1401858.1 transcriptional repressor [Bacteroides sp.]MCM1477732.1 transcriptional repressor [Bacteroides sp.]
MTDDKSKTTAVAAFTQYMIARRLRKTPERYAILDKVFDTVGHFSIDSLHAIVDTDGYTVSRATVYNTIELLIDAGLVRRHTFGNQAPQYEKITGMSRHYHLVCTSCGKVRELKDAEIDELLRTRRFGKFHPMYLDLNVYGQCATCYRRLRTLTRRSKKQQPDKPTRKISRIQQ